MFLKIAKEQTHYYKENLKSLVYKGDSIVEFCLTPIFDKSIRISNYKKQELKKIISAVEKTTKTLKEILELYEK